VAKLTECIREVPHGFEHTWRNPVIPGRNLVAKYPEEPGSIEFIHVPPAISGKPVEQWEIPVPLKSSAYFAAYPPKNILIVLEMEK
jgi:hypothetical protein